MGRENNLSGIVSASVRKIRIRYGMTASNTGEKKLNKNAMDSHQGEEAKKRMRCGSFFAESNMSVRGMAQSIKSCMCTWGAVKVMTRIASPMCFP
jgi:hypothetical protein